MSDLSELECILHYAGFGLLLIHENHLKSKLNAHLQLVGKHWLFLAANKLKASLSRLHQKDNGTLANFLEKTAEFSKNCHLL